MEAEVDVTAVAAEVVSVGAFAVVKDSTLPNAVPEGFEAIAQQ
jgi:hypothetical protein